MIFINSVRHYFISNFYLLFLLTFIFSISTLKSHDCISFVQAKKILEGFPDKPITQIDNSLSLEEAYCAQEKLNYLIKKKFNDKVGYKVGFTGEALQKRFKINTPAVGTIYKHMFLPNNSKISKEFGYRTMIEPDILVIIKSNEIMKAKTSLEILENISSVHPFVEIPALRFKKDEKVNGNMLVATNMLATYMVMAEGIKIEATEEGVKKLANIKTIFLDKDNNIIQEASTGNLMDNPLNVLKWLIEYLNNNQLTLKKGDKISLGSVGKLFPLSKNTYQYYFEGFEQSKNIIKVTVK
jgi:2-keto-4-pentenoate hydratase